jgi:DNA-binding NarL/FixJ family response regulator
VAGVSAPVRVLVVDDDALVRSALAMVLGGAAGLELVGEAGDGAEVPAAVERTRPDVVLMDIRMPRTDGLTATEALVRVPGAPAVIVLTTFDADDQVLRALRAGASGFLLKDTPPAAIVEAVRRVADGEPMLSPTVTRQLIAHVSAVRPAAPADVRQQPGPGPAGRAQRPRARGGPGGRPRAVQRPGRRRAVPERGDGEGARVPADGEAGAGQPGAGRAGRARRRPGLRPSAERGTPPLSAPAFLVGERRGCWA